MNRITRPIIALIMTGSLAACGGAATSTVERGTIDADIADFNTQFQLADVMFETTNMPTTGSATYTGEVGMDISRIGSATPFEATLIGDLELTADFGSGSVSGSARNFLLGDGAGNISSPKGTLGVAAGIAGNALTGSMTGDLKMRISGYDRDVEFDTLLDGKFKGSSAERIAGTIEGTASGDINLDVDAGLFYGQR